MLEKGLTLGNRPNTERSGLPAVEIKILSGFLLAMSLLLFGGAYTYRTSAKFADSVQWVAHTQDVRATLANLYGSLAGAELAQRDYLLTTQHARLDEYVNLIDVVQHRVAELARLTSDNAAQQGDRAALESVVKRRLGELAGVLTAYQSYGLPAAREVLRQSSLRSGTEDVRVISERIDSVEARLLAERQGAAAHVRRTTLISLLITLTLAASIFIVLFRGIHRGMVARRDAEHALRSSEQYNRSIVDGSPDCLAILTPDARLSQMTPQGRRLMEVEDFSSRSGAARIKRRRGAPWPRHSTAAPGASRDIARRGQERRSGGMSSSCP